MFESFFPAPPKYKTGTPTTVGGTTVKKLEKIMITNPTITGGGSAGAIMRYAGAAFLVVVPKGATKLQILAGPTELVPGGSGVPADLLATVGSFVSTPVDLSAALVADQTLTITPAWHSSDEDATTAGLLRCSLILMWL